MPNSLTKVLPLALVSSTRLPVSVCGTGNNIYSSVFSRPRVRLTSCLTARHRGLPPLATTIQSVAELPPRIPHQHVTGTGILTRCPSPTPLGLGLGPTNPTRTDLPSETLDFRPMRFSRISRYSCQHSHLNSLQRSLPDRLLRSFNAPLPYHQVKPAISLASVVCLSPVTLSAQLRLTSELLRTL